VRGRVGSLLEVGTGFHPELTGRENIYMNGAILGMRRSEIDSKFDEIVDFSEVTQYIDTPCQTLFIGHVFAPGVCGRGAS
jgi:lipopolysaccharide transport system ATP-binding protein